MSSRDEAIKILDDLLRMEDVLACMIAKKGLEGIVPSNMKVKDVDLWQLISKTTDNFFDLIGHFYIYGLSRIYFELGKYTIIIAPISETFSLVVIIPSLANMGLLDVEIENTKRKIEHIVEAQHG